MTNAIKQIILLATAALIIPLSEAKTVQVKGYTRKNGTYVAPHTKVIKDKASTPTTSAKTTTSRKAAATSAKAPTGTTTSTNSTSAVKLPNSYQVYQDRKATQGPRAFSKKMREEQYNAQGGICRHCNKHCTLSEMDADHIVPYSKGGKTEKSNLQMLCAHCNRSKGNKSSK